MGLCLVALAGTEDLSVTIDPSNNKRWSHTVTLQIPGYLLSFESIVRPVITIIALGLIWSGAARMPASAKSRYATAGVLSAVLIGWLAVAHCRRRRPVAVGKHRKAGLRDPAALARGGSGLSPRGRHCPRALG